MASFINLSTGSPGALPPKQMEWSSTKASVALSLHADNMH
jgi:hypothetical protein